MSRFLWSRSEDRRKLFLVGWDTVTKACNKGRLEVLDLGEMNAALSAKWIHHYGNEMDRLWRWIVCDKRSELPFYVVQWKEQEVFFGQYHWIPNGQE